MNTKEPFTRVVVLISANAEWQVLSSLSGFKPLVGSSQGRMISGETPFGEWTTRQVGEEKVLFMHGGWGKISAAASAQYAIDHWKPQLLINLGTCGGFTGQVEQGKILLVERTLVYDIIEQMGDNDQALRYYTTDLDLSWLDKDLPPDIQRSLLVSADRDLLPEDIRRLKDRYGAIAGDWESGAIAWVADRNHIPCLVIRGVTDLVGDGGSEAYGNYDLFIQRTREIMQKLLINLSWCIDKFFDFQEQSIKPF